MAPGNGDSQPPPPPPPPPPTKDVWEAGEGLAVHYFARSPWQWVMGKIKTNSMKQVESSAFLPSALITKQVADGRIGAASTPLTPSARRRRSNRKDRVAGPSTLKVEVSDSKTGDIIFAVHGTSSALDGLEDKDELVRTIQRCRCEHLNLSPPSILINWDVTHEECLNVIGELLPKLESKKNKNEAVYAVLKEPMGSQGRGIYFVQDAEETYKVISEHRQLAQKDSAFLDNLIQAKGRIPSWVLQAEVVPPLIIRDGRKFHIRTYVAVLEDPYSPDLLEIYVFNRHEIRIAGVSIKENDTERDPLAHITNGALSDTTERVLLHNEPDLVNRNLQEKVEVFVAEAFAKHMLSDITRRVSYSLRNDSDEVVPVRKFIVAGLDLMVTGDNRVFLLEANLYPSAPPESSVDSVFAKHLTGFFHDLVELVIGNPSPNFVRARDILSKQSGA